MVIGVATLMLSLYSGIICGAAILDFTGVFFAAKKVTPERVAMIDRAEQFLRARGLRELRVRYHKGDLARLEVPGDAIARLAEPALRREIVEHLRSLGFKFVTLDLEGFRSGSLNQLLSIDLTPPQ